VPNNTPKFTIYNYLYDLNEDYEKVFYKSVSPNALKTTLGSATPRLRSATSVGETLPGSDPAPTPAPPPGGLFGRQAGGFNQFPEG